jgi:hypothetical protein
LLAASEALADVLTPEALAWRLEAHLEEGSRKVNAWLTASPSWSSTVPATATLLVAGGRDLILPSVAETLRLQQRLPGSVRKVLPQAGHACLDDGRNLNLRLELALSGVLAKVEAAHKVRQRAASEAAARLAADKVAAAAAGSVQSWYDQGLRLNGKMAATTRVGLSDAAESEQQLEQQPDLDPAPNSLFETWLQSMRRLFSPLFFTVVGDTGLLGERLEPGVQGLQLPTDGRPVLFVGNHQLYGFDGPLLVEELLREGRADREGSRWFATGAARDRVAAWRGRLEAVLPVPMSSLEHDDLTALLQLESEGTAMRARTAVGEAFCHRRLLARVRRYMVERLRKAVEPVEPPVVLDARTRRELGLEPKGGALGWVLLVLAIAVAALAAWLFTRPSPARDAPEVIVPTPDNSGAEPSQVEPTQVGAATPVQPLPVADEDAGAPDAAPSP